MEYQKFLDQLRTTDDVELLKNEVGVLLNSLFETNPRALEDALNTGVRGKFADIFREELVKTEDKNAFLEELDKELNSVKLVKLTLAFEPTQNTLDKIYFLINEGRKENAVVEVDYDPTILGGVVITFEGEYRDYSLSRFMEMEFKNERQSIIKILESKTKMVPSN